MSLGLHGVLVVDKPLGPTSFDVVHQVRRALGVAKVGHTGTLDPMATGVLPLCLGDGTKVAQFMLEDTKAYEAQLKLGVATDTLDAQGTVTQTAPVPWLDAARVEAALQQFRGPLQQTPPMYSALKVGGKRLYELARAGTEVERAPRSVTVYELVAHDFSADTIRFSVRASKGFYVRTLAAELGQALGTVAHLTGLRRSISGQFTLAQAVPLAEVLKLGVGVASRVVSIDQALAGLPAFEVDAAGAAKVSHGVALEVNRPPGVYRVLGPSSLLLAVAEVTPARKFVYRRVLVSGE